MPFKKSTNTKWLSLPAAEVVTAKSIGNCKRESQYDGTTHTRHIEVWYSDCGLKIFHFQLESCLCDVFTVSGGLSVVAVFTATSWGGDLCPDMSASHKDPNTQNFSSPVPANAENHYN